ncbi:Adenylosuccinate lyase [Rhynchospora pubera]|uniref:Adenylosuccinate lyase n=1 Tax=Rhynchospora pubera TaxID=906938 RepID=A0AAV8HL03_9POAL|nr:Adenylosuccinate lyase [Rhynchospora pubera]
MLLCYQISGQVLDSRTSNEPLDTVFIRMYHGDWTEHLKGLSSFFSQFEFYLVLLNVEVKWLIHISQIPQVNDHLKLDDNGRTELNNVLQNFTVNDAHNMIMTVHPTPENEIVAVMDFLSKKCPRYKLNEVGFDVYQSPFKEDAKNLVYAIMFGRELNYFLFPTMERICGSLYNLEETVFPTMESNIVSGNGNETSEKVNSNRTLIEALNHLVNIARKVSITTQFSGNCRSYDHQNCFLNVDNWQSIWEDFIKLSFKIEYNSKNERIGTVREYLPSLAITIQVFNERLCPFIKELVDRNSGINGQFANNEFAQAESSLFAANEHLDACDLLKDTTDQLLVERMVKGLCYSLFGYLKVLEGLSFLH